MISDDSQFMDVLISLILAVALATVLMFGLKDFGIHYDEGNYFRAGSSYLSWLRHPSWKTINSVWSENHEHPPAHKVVAAFTRWLFHDVLRMTDIITGYRMSSLVFAAMTVWALYWLTLNLYGRAEALLASLILFLLPRVFYDGHLVTLDLSAMALWTCLAAVVWDGWKENAESPIRLGFFTGLALLAKINAPFAVFSRYPLVLKRYWISQRRLVPGRLILAREIKLAFGLFLTGFVIFVGGWPWLWGSPLQRTLEFITFHSQHQLILVYYLGKIYAAPPWHFPYVMLCLTSPAVLFVLFFIGLIHLARNWREDRALFVLSNMFLPVFLVQMSNAKYDGVRLFLPTFPFVAILSAVALTTIVRRIRPIRVSQGLLVASSAALLLYLGQQDRNYYPYTDAYFSEWIGGIRGAEKLGMDVQYWCNSSLGLLDWMEKHKSDQIWPYLCEHIFNEYYMYGRIDWRPKVVASRDRADYWIFFNRTAYLGDAYAKELRTAKSEWSIEIEGVRLVGVYHREDVPPGAPMH